MDRILDVSPEQRKMQQSALIKVYSIDKGRSLIKFLQNKLSYKNLTEGVGLTDREWLLLSGLLDFITEDTDPPWEQTLTPDNVLSRLGVSHRES